jgi:hypothetical protein
LGEGILAVVIWGKSMKGGKKSKKNMKEKGGKTKDKEETEV